MGFAGMFCEGTVYDWSSVYFSSVVKPDEAFIRAGYVAGMGAMTLGRFMADGFVTKYGPARVLKVCGGLILGGLWLAAALPYLIPATLGFLLVVSASLRRFLSVTVSPENWEPSRRASPLPSFRASVSSVSW